MYNSKVIAMLLAAVFISSCIFKVPKHSDNACENINDVSIQMIVRHVEDSLVRTILKIQKIGKSDLTTMLILWNG